MEIVLAVSGMLALLGGGAGLVAYYRKTVAGGSTSPTTAGGAPGFSNTPGGTVFSTIVGGLKPTGGGGGGISPTVLGILGGSTDTSTNDPSAGVILSPLPGTVGRSTVVDPDAPIDTGAAAPPPSKIFSGFGLSATVKVNTSTTPPEAIL